MTDGIAWQLPSLTLYTKLLRKAASLNMSTESGESARRRALGRDRHSRVRSTITRATRTQRQMCPSAWGDALSALVAAARYSGVDLESVLRARALSLRDAIRENEATKLAE